MQRGDTQQVGGASVMGGIVKGVEKRTMRPIVDGIVSGLPRKAKPSAATPTETCMSSATKIPSAAFGSGVFGEGAGAAKHSAHKPSMEHEGATVHKKVRGRPKKEGTTKGEERKTARKAYEK